MQLKATLKTVLPGFDNRRALYGAMRASSAASSATLQNSCSRVYADPDSVSKPVRAMASALKGEKLILGKYGVTQLSSPNFEQMVYDRMIGSIAAASCSRR